MGSADVVSTQCVKESTEKGNGFDPPMVVAADWKYIHIQTEVKAFIVEIMSILCYTSWGNSRSKTITRKKSSTETVASSSR